MAALSGTRVGVAIRPGSLRLRPRGGRSDRRAGPRSLGPVATAPAAAAAAAADAAAAACAPAAATSAACTAATGVAAFVAAAGGGAAGSAAASGCRGVRPLGALRVREAALGGSNLGGGVGLGSSIADDKAARAVPAEGVSRDSVGLGKGVGEVGLRLPQGKVVVAVHAEGGDATRGGDEEVDELPEVLLGVVDGKLGVEDVVLDLLQP